MNEKSPLLRSQIKNINSDSNDQNSFSEANRHFKWVIPSEETVKERKDRMFSIYLCYLCMFFSSVSYTITISSMWPFLQQVINIKLKFFKNVLLLYF